MLISILTGEQNVILADFALLSQYMGNYEISQKGIDAYKDELGKEEVERKPEDIDYDDFDFSEPEDEETFRMRTTLAGCSEKWKG